MHAKGRRSLDSCRACHGLEATLNKRTDYTLPDLDQRILGGRCDVVRAVGQWLEIERWIPSPLCLHRRWLGLDYRHGTSIEWLPLSLIRTFGRGVNEVLSAMASSFFATTKAELSSDQQSLFRPRVQMLEKQRTIIGDTIKTISGRLSSFSTVLTIVLVGTSRKPRKLRFGVGDRVQKCLNYVRAKKSYPESQQKSHL